MLVAIFFDKKYLIYALPACIVSIGVLYWVNRKKNNWWYIVGLGTILVCDIFIYTDFVTNFKIICLLTGVYFVTSSLALRKYVFIKRIKLVTFFSIPMIICSGLITYLVYAISDLIIDLLEEAIIEVTFCVFVSIIYVLITYAIYMQEMYQYSIQLIVVSCLCIFIVSLLPINEVVYSHDIFTVLINIAHVFSLYFFMKFLVETSPEKRIAQKEKYL